MFVGRGAARVRNLFSRAAKTSPCIVFFDELDALGKQRSMGANMGSNDEAEQTLNQVSDLVVGQTAIFGRKHGPHVAEAERSSR